MKAVEIVQKLESLSQIYFEGDETAQNLRHKFILLLHYLGHGYRVY